MRQLGMGLSAANHQENALSVKEAELSMLRHFSASPADILSSMSSIAWTHAELGHMEKALSMERELYSEHLKFYGDDHPNTLVVASNLATSLRELRRVEEAKALLRRTLPVARRVLGESTEIMLKIRLGCAAALYEDPAATLDDLREAVTTLGEIERTARRVLGGTHPLTVNIERALRYSREALSARNVSALREAMEAMTPGDA
jgi:hypothetical protein